MKVFWKGASLNHFKYQCGIALHRYLQMYLSHLMIDAQRDRKKKTGTK